MRTKSIDEILTNERPIKKGIEQEKFISILERDCDCGISRADVYEWEMSAAGIDYASNKDF